MYAGFAGAFLGVCLLKFGNPPVLDHLIDRPSSLAEFVYQAWPARWAYYLLAVLVVLAGAACISRETGAASAAGPPIRSAGVSPRRGSIESVAAKCLVWLPLAWLLWQFVTSTQTTDAKLTGVTLAHFTAMVICFYLAMLVLSRIEWLGPFWAGLGIGFVLMLWIGFGQHYGGLEATRNYVYSQPGWERLPAEHLKRLGSSRIFATLLYPNTFAGVLLLLLPPALVLAWRQTRGFGLIGQGVATGLAGYAGVACLVWSGSKAGWLIALVVVTIALIHLQFRRKAKLSMILALVAIGLIVFFGRFAGYFAKGATSVGARFEYWKAAVKVFSDNPLWGTGPGTFSVWYRRLKPPDAEMAMLTHNDYLQQASDSGLMGALLYLAFIGGSIAFLYGKCRTDALRMSVWLGLVGWALQGFVEFGLYIPALGWTAFWLLGWLWGLASPANWIDGQGSSG